MSSISVTTKEVQGFVAYEVTNGLVSFTIIPRLGGKLSSLRDCTIDREWLWTNPHFDYQVCEYGASYVLNADVGGWDECFPSVVETVYPSDPWKGIPIPDHGEIWSQNWPTHITLSSEEKFVSVSTEAQGKGKLPYTFYRTIHMHSGLSTLRFEYMVTSQADADMPFTWCAHPIIAIEPGMQIIVPSDTKWHNYSRIPNDLPLNSHDMYYWPIKFEYGNTLWNMESLPDRAANLAFKVWSEPLSTGKASLIAKDGRFHFEFDTKQIPQFGLWFNLGGASGIGSEHYYNMGFEPCIGGPEDLYEAVTRPDGYFGTLPAHGICSWSFEVTLES
jgi:hypothetical protein